MLAGFIVVVDVVDFAVVLVVVGDVVVVMVFGVVVVVGVVVAFDVAGTTVVLEVVSDVVVFTVVGVVVVVGDAAVAVDVWVVLVLVGVPKKIYFYCILSVKHKVNINSSFYIIIKDVDYMYFDIPFITHVEDF